MIRALKYALPTAVVLVGLMACEDPGTNSGIGSLQLRIESSPNLRFDAGRVIVSGSKLATPRTVDIARGQTRQIDALPAGPYTVTVQGLVGGEIESAVERAVTVQAGPPAEVRLGLADFISFVVQSAVVPPGATSLTFTVTHPAVQGAASYKAEAATNAEFTENYESETGTGAPISLTVSSPGTYLVRIRALDRQGNEGLPSSNRSIEVYGSNTPPTARAGDGQDANRGDVVTLDASGSTDPNLGQTLQYAWIQVGGPLVTLTGANTDKPTFTAPGEVTTLEFQVTVRDGQGESTARTTVWVLEDKDKAFWVSPTGDNANPGTRAQPLAAIQNALNAANTAGGGDVYVAAGTYVQAASLFLRPNVSVYGGYDPVSFLRDIAAHETIIDGRPSAVVGSSATAAAIDGFTIISADNTAAGGSSIGILLSNSDNVVISRTKITAGRGANGNSAPVATAGVNGDAGNGGAAGTGQTGSCLTRSGGGGGTGTLQNSGGTGGTGTCGTGGSGSAGTGNPGSGGGGGSGTGTGGRGDDGGPGGAGANGTGAASFGSVSASGYTPAAGVAGQPGASGSGGGGGGGGGGGNILGIAYYSGGGGGGGGSGASGGGGGLGGGGGGGSFGILVANGSTGVTITNCVITTSAGGLAGAGAAGGPGGAQGGGGGAGGANVSGSSGIGGRGGDGGPGGTGGRGGGGGGGTVDRHRGGCHEHDQRHSGQPRRKYLHPGRGRLGRGGRGRADKSRRGCRTADRILEALITKPSTDRAGGESPPPARSSSFRRTRP